MVGIKIDDEMKSETMYREVWTKKDYKEIEEIIEKKRARERLLNTA